MIRRPPRSTRTDTLVPYTTLVRATRGMDYFAVGSDQIAAEVQFDYHLSTGVERRVRIAAFVPFVDDRMAGETQYVDRYLAEEIDRLLGEDFSRIAGVSFI